MNDIRNPEEKTGGRIRSVVSCKGFREFIEQMNMEELEFKGRQWTWANNWQNEGYIEARLDRFFGASLWPRENENAIVHHVERQSSDHCMLVVDTDPAQERKKRRFYFDKRWLNKPGIEEVIRKAWGVDCIGSSMFQVAQKIKRCRMDLIQWNKTLSSNSATRIQQLKEDMVGLQEAGGQRDWDKWNS